MRRAAAPWPAGRALVAAGELAVHGGEGRRGRNSVGERVQNGRDAAAEVAAGALPLGVGDGLAVVAIGRDELEQVWRLGQHRPGSFREALRRRLRAFDESQAIRRLSNDVLLGKTFP
jgi:hypothetical protein